MTEAALVQRPTLPASGKVLSFASIIFLLSKKTWRWSPLAFTAKSCQTPLATLPFQPADFRRSPFTNPPADNVCLYPRLKGDRRQCSGWKSKGIRGGWEELRV